jgi:hypothetical protein
MFGATDVIVVKRNCGVFLHFQYIAIAKYNVIANQHMLFQTVSIWFITDLK